jgi:ATP-binding cassette subfamily B protein
MSADVTAVTRLAAASISAVGPGRSSGQDTGGSSPSVSCQSCGVDIPAAARYCRRCGAEQPKMLPVRSPRWTLARLFVPFFLPHWPAITLTAALVLAGTVTGLLRPWPLKFLFDAVLLPGASASSTHLALILIALAIAGIAVLDAVLGFLRQYVLKAAGHRVAFSLRLALYGQIQRLSLAFHDRQQTGELMTRVTKDVDKVQDLITGSVVDATANVLTLGGMVVVMLVLDWQLALAMVALLPALFVSVSRYRRRIKQAEQELRRKEGDITSLAQETISSIRLVKAFGREDFERERFEAETEEALDANLRVSRVEAAFGSLMDVLLAVALAALVWLGAQRVIAGDLTPGDLLVFITYIREFYGPTRALSKLAGQVSRTAVRAEKVAEVLLEQPAIRDLPGAVDAPPLHGDIRFEHVDFHYERKSPVLVDVDFEAHPGQLVALVGASGAGKSSLVGLIARLYEPNRGRILVDGRDIRSYTLASVQKQIGFVLQSSVLFRASIRENIAYGRPDARFPDIVRAARIANADEFILKLPRGYDTIVGERGDTLSGGQRQRIVLARAVVRDAPILILDEPTTGLDARSERVLLDALERVIAGRTTIVIAHKLSTVRRADVILVIDQGRIVERGRDEELIVRGGRYAELDRLQRPPASASGHSAPSQVEPSVEEVHQWPTPR